MIARKKWTPARRKKFSATVAAKKATNKDWTSADVELINQKNLAAITEGGDAYGDIVLIQIGDEAPRRFRLRRMSFYKAEEVS